jgi:hypothetical protein
LQAHGQRRLNLQAAARGTGGGGSPAISPVKPRTCYRALINRAKTPKQRGRTGGFTELLEGDEEAPVVQIGVEVRPVGPCSGELPWGGGVEERRSSNERCGLKRCSGGGFYRWRGEERGRGRGGGAAHRWTAIDGLVARCAAVSGEGRERGRGWAAPGECAAH